MSGFSGYLFEGGTRSKPYPTADFGGRQQFLQRVQNEREKRGKSKQQIEAATIIQSVWRGYAYRRQFYQKLREEFDAGIASITVANASPDALLLQMKRLFRFVDVKQDSDRIMLVCQLLVTNNNSVSRHPSYPIILRRFTPLCLGYLHMNAPDKSKPVGMALRFVELFFGYLFGEADPAERAKRLANLLSPSFISGYFSAYRKMLDHRIPQDLLESTLNAPTPLALSLCESIKQGFVLCSIAPRLTNGNSEDNGSTSSCVLQPQSIASKLIRASLEALFLPKFTPVIRYYVIPTLSQWSEFPLSLLLRTVVMPDDGTIDRIVLNDLSSDAALNLLYAVIALARPVGSLESKKCDKLLSSAMALLLPQIDFVHHFVMDSGAEVGSTSMETSQSDDFANVWKGCYEALDDDEMVARCLNGGNATTLCHISSALLKIPSGARPSKLLYRLPFKPDFLKSLWLQVCSESRPTFGESTRPLLQELQAGFELSPGERARIIPPLHVFCALFSKTLIAVHDEELKDGTAGSAAHDGAIVISNPLDNGPVAHVPMRQTPFVPFTMKMLCQLSGQLRDLALGLLTLAYPEQQSMAFSFLFRPTERNNTATASAAETVVRDFNHLFEAVVTLLQLLHERDNRVHFCDSADHWIAPVSKPVLHYFNALRRTRTKQRGFGGPVMYNLWHVFSATRPDSDSNDPDDVDEAAVVPLSASERRAAAILRKVPFTVPFKTRVQILGSLIHEDRAERGGSDEWHRGINVRIRRNYLYEDAFERLLPENEPNLRLPIRITMTNWVGLDEAGVDGGGIFREFLNELLKTAFDPSRGFFCSTADGFLYPNPLAPTLFPQDYKQHYYFLGRMLGKAIYERMLVELPFTQFFELKLLSRPATIHHLSSLDPILHRNLLYLKYYDGDVQDLHLDFSITVEELGSVQKVELCPSGSDILVTNANCIEYIHLMADYYLNRQIRAQTGYFRQGLADLIDLDWLCMFDPCELQTLISGADSDIDIADMRANAYYSGGYKDDHPAIEMFWRVVHDLTPNQRHKLLKFITSCSRPPLLGFKDLFPPLNIQQVPQSNRLPTASTCMNLLKLPSFSDEKTLRDKLLYAIESGAGFELS